MSDTPHPITERLDQLAKLKEEARTPGNEASVRRQHERGKLTARERLDLLLDPGSFVELDMLARHRAHGFGIENNRPLTDGVVTGWGTVDGRKIFVFSQDFTIFGGALGEVYAEKIHKVMDLAESTGAPLVGLNDGGGARIQEGVVSLASYGGIFHRNVKASGVIPQISVVLGPCAGGAVYSPAMTDFIFMVKGVSNMYITGPDVVKTVTGEDVTHEELGGALTHATKSGVATFVADDEQHCIEQVRYLLSFLPSNNLEDPPHFESEDDPERSCDGLLELIPETANRAYDMKKVIADIVDDGEFFEVFPLWAMNIVCGFARVDGHVIGIVGNQPQVLAGCLDIDASEKAARFVRTCDAFNVPLVTFVDVPGFLPGHRSGVRRHHPARREAALRVLRGDGAAGADHHPQGLRRRVRRHELEVDRRRHRVRVAVGRDRGDGCGRRGQHHSPQGDRVRARCRLAAGRVEARVRRPLPQPVPGGRARLRRRRDRPARHAPHAGAVARDVAHEARAVAVAQAREHAPVTPEEVAAVTAVTVALQQRDAAAASAAGDAGPEPLSAWVDASRRSAQNALMQRGPWRLSSRIGRRSRT